MAVHSPVPTAADIEAVQEVLKEVWPSDNIESQLYEDTVFLDQIEDVSEFTDSNGLHAAVPIRTGRTGGISSRAIGEQLGVADHQKTKKARYEYTNQYLQVKVEGPVVARMRTNRQACIREIDKEIRWGMEDVRRDWQRQLYADGSAVIVSGLAAQAASTTVLLGADNYWVLERGLLYEGQRIDIGTVANPQLDTGFNRILSIVDDSAAPAIVMENAVTVTVNSAISLAGNRNADGEQRELNGIGNLFSDSEVLGELDPANVHLWKAVVMDNGGVDRALSISLLTSLIRKLRAGGRYPDKALSDLEQEQAYYLLLQGQVRFAGEQNLAAADSAGLAVGKIKSGLMADPDCPPSQLLMWHSGALAMYSAGPIAWQNQTTGGDILAWSQGYDAFVARAAKYFQVGSDRRRSLGRLLDLERITD